MIAIRPMTHADIAVVKVIEDELFPIDAWSKELFLEETEVLGSKGRVETATPIHWFLSFR